MWEPCLLLGLGGPRRVPCQTLQGKPQLDSHERRDNLPRGIHEPEPTYACFPAGIGRTRRRMQVAYWVVITSRGFSTAWLGPSNEREGRMSEALSLDRVGVRRQADNRCLRAIVFVFAAIGLTLIPLA